MLQVEPIGLAKTWNSLEALAITDPVIPGERPSKTCGEIAPAVSRSNQGFRRMEVPVDA